MCCLRELEFRHNRANRNWNHMSVKLRLARVGAKKNPFYRVVVADSRSPRDGRFIEHVGIYDPTRKPEQVRLKMDRLDYWLKVGAQPSETVGHLIDRARREAEKTQGQ